MLIMMPVLLRRIHNKLLYFYGEIHSMMRLVLTLCTFIFTGSSIANEAVKNPVNSGFKRAELGVGLVYGEPGYGVKIKYQLSDYLVGFELNSIDLSESYLFGPETRDANNESGDYWVMSATIGKDWSHDWFSTAVDIGIGYGVGGEHTNCTNERSDGKGFGVCDYEIERVITVPISATFVVNIGKRSGIGLSLTHSFSSLEYNTGLKIIIPIGSYD